jgi:hypothetical protein
MRRILSTGFSLALLAYAVMASAQPPAAAPQPAPNRAPTIRVTCEPCTVDVGQTARITATAIDPDGDVLVYHWIAPAGTLADATQAQTTWTAPQEEGSVALTAVADDGRGGIASDYVRIVIKRAPRIHAFDDKQARVQALRLARLRRTRQTVPQRPAWSRRPSEETFASRVDSRFACRRVHDAVAVSDCCADGGCHFVRCARRPSGRNLRPRMEAR